MAEPTDIRIHPVWRETPDYALLAIALIRLAEQLQERQAREAEQPDGADDSSAEDGADE